MAIICSTALSFLPGWATLSRVAPADRLHLRITGPQSAPFPWRRTIWCFARPVRLETTALISSLRNTCRVFRIGVGSADAAATLVALSRLWDVPASGGWWPVAWCRCAGLSHRHPVRMTGVGEGLLPFQPAGGPISFWSIPVSPCQRPQCSGTGSDRSPTHARNMARAHDGKCPCGFSGVAAQRHGGRSRVHGARDQDGAVRRWRQSRGVLSPGCRGPGPPVSGCFGQGRLQTPPQRRSARRIRIGGWRQPRS